MLEVKNIKAKNFRSYGSNLSEIKFEKNELILVAGKNGGGKSSLFSTAIHFAIFGDNPKGKKADLINDINKKDLYVEVELYDTVKETNYKICRGIKPDINKLFVNDEEQDSGMYKKDFDNMISELLSIDKDFFNKFINNNVVSGMNFLSAPKGEKQKIFNYVFDLDNIQNLKNFVKNKKKSIDKEKVDIQNEVKINEINFSNEKEKSQLLEEDIKNIENSIVKYKEEQKMKAKETANKKIKIRKDIRENISLYRELKESLSEMPFVSIDLIKTIKKDISSERDNFSAIKAKLDLNTSERTKIFKDLESGKYDEEIVKAQEIINFCEKEILTTDNKIDVLLKEDSDLTKIDEDISENKIKIAELKSKIKYNSETESVLLSKKEKILNAVNVGEEEIKKETKEIDKKCSENCVYRNLNPLQQLTDINSDLTRIDNENKDYSNIIKDKIEILNKLNSTRDSIVEIIENLDRLKKYKYDLENKLNSNKELLETKKAEKEKASNKINELKKESSSLSEQQEKVIEKGKQLKSKLEEIEKNNYDYETKKSSLDKIFQLIQFTLKEYDNLKSSSVEYNKIIEDQKNQLKYKKDKVKNNNKKLKEYEQVLLDNKQTLDKIETESIYIDFILENVMDNTQLVKYVIDSNIRIIEKLVNVFLQRFELHSSLKLGFNKDLELNFSNGKPYEEFSEGEKLRIKMAFAFSFLFYLKELNKNKVSLLILDEILSSSADDFLIDKVFDILEELRKELTVIVISHDDRLKDRFSTIYEVNKNIYSSIQKVE
jgi:DNA repair exonuclease SbcCD ATPase subunit